MEKSEKDRTMNGKKNGDFFQDEEIDNPFDNRIALSKAINKSLKTCGMSRAEVASKMSNMLKYFTVTMPMLEKWASSECPDHLPKINVLSALCYVTGKYYSLEVIACPLPGCRFIQDKEALAFELYEAKEKLKKEQERITYLENQLNGNDEGDGEDV